MHHLLSLGAASASPLGHRPLTLQGTLRWHPASQQGSPGTTCGAPSLMGSQGKDGWKVLTWEQVGTRDDMESVCHPAHQRLPCTPHAPTPSPTYIPLSPGQLLQRPLETACLLEACPVLLTGGDL